MELNLEIQKKLSSEWFLYLQNLICEEFEAIEQSVLSNTKKRAGKFKKNIWNKKKANEGGGQYFILNNGKVFDQVGVNFSRVQGKFSKNFKSKIPGANKSPYYWASGISVVAHMKNPKIPAVHFNTRFITTSRSWFGGGMDVTPSYKDNEEKLFVHKNLKNLCFQNKKSYKNYKKWCDKYFFINHRKEPRGIGGIFFDYLYNDWEQNFKFIRELGLCFLSTTKDIIDKKISSNWNLKQKHKQYLKRKKYVEFNLLYDRGTKFGLNTGGNVDAIFMSLPPLK
jgi:coproporphyrinogen III oxidase